MEQTIVDRLRSRLRSNPKKNAFTFLIDGEQEYAALSYEGLDLSARAVAARLQLNHLKGEKVLLLYAASLDYIIAFMACMYAGVIAIPAYPPNKNRSFERIESIVNDSGARIALATRDIVDQLQKKFAAAAALADLQWLATDDIPLSLADQYQPFEIDPGSLAFLQYTSGSIGSPKGVMVSHQNIMRNQEVIKEAFEVDERDVVVSWLPIYHDMGLIGMVLQPIYLGATCILMSPVSFLQKPIRWLKAISKYKATVSGAPNFAYNLCIERINPIEMEGLDLSNWGVALSGAEPIQAKTLERFTEKFAQPGFRMEAFYPCYGMAEATLFITGASKNEMPVTIAADASALEKGGIVPSLHPQHTRSIVSCGKTRLTEKVIIVDQHSLEALPENMVGEIWFSGGSMAMGYWNRPEETVHTFRARLSNNQKNDQSFLRTGDLGFISSGELYITGRLKDLIILNGRNHYPQDIEKTAGESHQALRKDCSAAFSRTVNGKEQLIIAIEVERVSLHNINTGEVTDAIRRAVFESHEIMVSGIALLKPGSIYKTSSGKIQRSACKEAYLANNLQEVYKHEVLIDEGLNSEEKDEGRQQIQKASFSAAAIESWIINWLAKKLHVQEVSLSNAISFNNAGLDSVASIEFAEALGNWLGLKLDPTLVWNYPTIETLAKHLAAPASTVEEPNNVETIAVHHIHTPENDTEKLSSMTEEDLAILLSNEMNR